MDRIGQRLRTTRERRLMPQTALAARAGVQQVTISRIENDRQASRPRLNTIRKLAAALDVDPAWLMFGDGGEDIKSAACSVRRRRKPDTDCNR